MDARSFDALARGLATDLPRRRTIALLGGAASSLLALGAPPVAAGCKKVGKKCDKNKDCCKNARCGGKRCKCKSRFTECGGKCFDLEKDEQHCGNCSTACAADETCCDGHCVDLQTDVNNCGSCDRVCDENVECAVGVCRFPPGTCLHGLAACETAATANCGVAFDCRCYRNTEGEIACGDVASVERPCGECASSADCASYGPGAFCIETGTRFCGCGTSAQNYCGVPCDT